MAKTTGGSRMPPSPRTSAPVKTTAGKVLQAGKATPKQATQLAASVMAHEEPRAKKK